MIETFFQVVYLLIAAAMALIGFFLLCAGSKIQHDIIGVICMVPSLIAIGLAIVFII